jgi:hypothetical protein
MSAHLQTVARARLALGLVVTLDARQASGNASRFGRSLNHHLCWRLELLGEEGLKRRFPRPNAG